MSGIGTCGIYAECGIINGVKSGANAYAENTLTPDGDGSPTSSSRRIISIKYKKWYLFVKCFLEGAFGATVAAQKQGFLGDVVKIWLTAADERVCPICGGLDGETVNLHARFSNGLMYPPAHPQCRCAVAYEEVTPNLQPSPQGSIMPAGGDTMMENHLAWLETATEEQKIKFFGGKTKAALYDAGLLAPADFHKPLKHIDLSGMEIPDRAAIKHAVHGDFNRAGTRITGGAHGHNAIAELQSRGITVNTTRTAANGVIFGNIPGHDTKFKRAGDKQTWFPAAWTEQDIFSAGIATANCGAWVGDPATSYQKEFLHKGVNVRVIYTNRIIASIMPSYDQP